MEESVDDATMDACLIAHRVSGRNITEMAARMTAPIRSLAARAWLGSDQECRLRAASRSICERIKLAPADNTLIREGWKFEPVEGKESARMYIDRSTADLRTDAENRYTASNGHAVIDAVVLSTDASAGEQWT